MNKRFKVIFSFSILSIFIYYFITYVQENNEIITSFRDISLFMIIIFIAFNLVSYVIRTLINIFLFKSMKINLKFFEAFYLVYMNTLGNLLGPLKAGSGYKLHYLYKNYDLKISQYVSLNTAYAIMSIFLNFFIVAMLLPLNDNGFQTSYILSSLLVLIVGLIFLIVFKLSKRLEDKTKYQTLNNFVIGFNSLVQDKKNFGILLFLGLIQILYSVILIFLCFYFFNFEIDLLSLIFYVGIGSLSGIFKFTPGNIGTYEIIMIFTQGFHNVDTLSIITTSVFLRLISYLTLGIIGINKGIKKLKKAL